MFNVHDSFLIIATLIDDPQPDSVGSMILMIVVDAMMIMRIETNDYEDCE